MIPTADNPPKFYAAPKINKPDMPLRPIVSNCGAIFYEVAKMITKILKPLVGPTQFHMSYPQELVDYLEDVSLQENEEMVSVDVMHSLRAYQ